MDLALEPPKSSTSSVTAIAKHHGSPPSRIGGSRSQVQEPPRQLQPQLQEPPWPTPIAFRRQQTAAQAAQATQAYGLLGAAGE